MFEKLEQAPADPILGLTEAFRKDTNPGKINLGVGVYKDAKGQTPILDSVKRAELRLLEKETTKSYLPISGDPVYGTLVQEMVFGKGSSVLADGRAATAHTPGGTGALRVGADFIKQQYPGARIWLSTPTWENHANVFSSAGIEVKQYPYYDDTTKSLALEPMLETLNNVPAGDVVLLHACCHNPTGMDPNQAQWEQVAEVAARCGFLTFFDFAYQGFGEGLAEDAFPVRLFAEKVNELIIASSFSKNFGLYNERTGALTVVAENDVVAQKAFSNVKRAIRANYSNPPSHGGLVVATILQDAELKALWESEVAMMRDRISGMRQLFVETLKAKGATGDFSFITTQKGMFSFSGLNKTQVQTLRETYSLYIVGSGRINVAGMTEANMDALCDAIVKVL